VNAQGIDTTASTAKDDVVSRVWSEFADRVVRRVENETRLIYWGSLAVTEPPQEAFFNTAGLLKNGDGRCGAWHLFFNDCLKAQGITNGVPSGITTKDLPSQGLMGFGFIVLPSAPAQGNLHPQNGFRDHAVVRYPGTGGKIYDPSYGNLLNDLNAWEDASIVVLVYKNSSGSQVNRANTSAVAETQIQP
jgi:hypothetical protein